VSNKQPARAWFTLSTQPPGSPDRTRPLRSFARVEYYSTFGRAQKWRKIPPQWLSRGQSYDEWVRTNPHKPLVRAAR